jgi:hypothetical protein
MIKTVVGIDLAATLQSAKVGMAVVENRGVDFYLISTKLAKTTEEILHFIDDSEFQTPTLLAIDAPLQLPLSGKPSEYDAHEEEKVWPMVYTYRPWEYLVFEKLRKEYGISGRPFSSLTITYRAQVLKGLLQRRGWKLVASPGQTTDRCFTEVFPNLTMGVLEPRRLNGREDKEERRQNFVKRLFAEGYLGVYLKNESGEELEALMNYPDVLDAIICAWTGAIFVHSSVQPKVVVCLGDDEYGFVICPFTARFESLLRDNPNDLIHSHTIL